MVKGAHLGEELVPLGVSQAAREFKLTVVDLLTVEALQAFEFLMCHQDLSASGLFP